MAKKTRLRFVGRGDDNRYYWESVLPINPSDSRHEQFSCDVDWFWSGGDDG